MIIQDGDGTLRHPYKLMDLPQLVPVHAYDSAVDAMIRRLSSNRAVKSIYQIGGVTSPGISDIDLVAVFEDGARALFDPRSQLADRERYLFVHDLYGASVSEFRALQEFSLFHNYKLLWGEELQQGSKFPTDDDRERLKTQIALEFLLRMYINMVVQVAYGVIKVRGFLLHAKAVLYDLQFLGVESGRLFELTHRCIEVRDSWWDSPLSQHTMSQLFNTYYKSLLSFLAECLSANVLFLPMRDRYSIASLIQLKQRDSIGFKRNGILLPSLLTAIGNKYFNLQNRTNRFDIYIPYQNTNIPGFLEHRFACLDSARDYHKANLPSFSVMMTSLVV